MLVISEHTVARHMQKIFRNARSKIAPFRLPAPEDFLWQYVHSTRSEQPLLNWTKKYALLCSTRSSMRGSNSPTTVL